MSSPGKGTEESKPISSEPTDELNTPNPNITESADESKKSDPNITGTTIESQKSCPNLTVSTDESKKPDSNITDSTCEPKAPTPAIKETEEPNKKSPVPMEKYKVPSTSLILSPSQRRPREPQMAMSPRKEDNEFEMPEEERQMIASFLRGCSLRMNEYISSFEDVATDLNFLTLGYRYMSRVLSCFDQDADGESDPSRCNEMRTHKVETSPLRALPAPQSTFRQSAIPRVSKVAVNLNLAFQSVSSVKSVGISESKRQTQGENLEIVEHETQTANEENVLSRRIFEERRKQKSLEEQFSLLSITEKDDTRDLRIGALSRRILEERRMQKSLEEQFPLLSLAEDDDTTDLQMGSLDSHIHASGARKFEVTEMGFKRRRSVSEEGGNRAKVPLIGTVPESTRQGEDQSASTSTETTIAETSGNPEIAEDEFSSLGALAYSLTSQSRIPTEISTNVNAEITDALGISTTEISETLEYVSDYLKELGDLGPLIFDDTSTTIPGVDEYQTSPNVSTFSSETSQPVISYSSEEPPLTIPQAINILDFEKSGTMSELEKIKINISPNSEASTSVKTLVSDEYLSPGYIPSTAKTEAFKANIPLTSESSTSSTFLSDEYLFAGYSPSTAKTEAFKANIPLTSESSTSSTLASGEYLSAGYIPSTAKTEAFKTNIPLTLESSTSVDTLASGEYYIPTLQQFEGNLPTASEATTLVDTSVSNKYLTTGLNPTTLTSITYRVPELPEITNQSSKFNVKTHSMGLTAPIVRDQSRPDISLPEKLPAGAPISTIFRVPEMPQITVQPSIPGFKSNFKVLRTPPKVGRARRDQDIPETSSTTSPTERPELGASGWSSLPTTPDSHYAKTPSLNVTIPIVRSYKSSPEKPFSRSLPMDLRTIYSRQSLERSLLPTNPSIVRSQERVDPTIIKPQTRLAGRDKGVPHTHIPSSLREDKKTSEAPSSSKMSAKLYKFLSETPASDIARMTSYFGVQQNIAETYVPSSSKPGTELSPYRNSQRFTSHLPPFSTEFLSPPIRDFANKLASSTSGGGIENPVPGPSGLRSGGSVDKTESKSDPHSEWIKNTMLYKLLELPPFEELGVTQYYKQFSATIPEEKEVSPEEKKRLEEEEKKEEEKKKWIEEEKKKITLTELLK